jgi:hypothetical protein
VDSLLPAGSGFQGDFNDEAQVRAAPDMGMQEGYQTMVSEVASIGDRNLLLTDVGALVTVRGQASVELQETT